MSQKFLPDGGGRRPSRVSYTYADTNQNELVNKQTNAAGRDHA